MHLEKLTPTKYRMTLHAYELASIMAAVRWMADGAEGELPAEMKDQMKSIVGQYDHVSQHLLKLKQ